MHGNGEGELLRRLESLFPPQNQAYLGGKRTVPPKGAHPRQQPPHRAPWPRVRAHRSDPGWPQQPLLLSLRVAPALSIALPPHCLILRPNSTICPDAICPVLLPYKLTPAAARETSGPVLTASRRSKASPTHHPWPRSALGNGHRCSPRCRVDVQRF